jgi:hypothetical protein
VNVADLGGFINQGRADLVRSLGRIELWRGVCGREACGAGWGRGLDLRGLSQRLSGNGFDAGRRVAGGLDRARRPVGKVAGQRFTAARPSSAAELTQIRATF